ncbi:hypothetical protein ACQEVG_25320 [Streptomyces sp. CA-135486]
MTHLRVRDYSFGLQYPFLALAAATPVLGVDLRVSPDGYFPDGQHPSLHG